MTSDEPRAIDVPAQREPHQFAHAPNRRPRADVDEPRTYAHAPNRGTAADPDPRHAVDPANPAEPPEPLDESTSELAVADAEPQEDADPEQDAASHQDADPEQDAETAEQPVQGAPAHRPWHRPEPEQYEPPASRRYDPARWLRSLAGIDERLLRQVWFERARHTALGGIILGTGLIAALSMWTALNAAFGYESLLHLVPALIWFVFIVSLDRALVSTMFGTGRRWGAFLMRLALAVMFGFIIAEPLTIAIFRTAIEQHIRDERTASLDELRSTLLACNSKETATGTSPAPAGCESFLLSFDQTPVAAEGELAARRQDEATLKAIVDADEAELARLTEMARKECAGTAGDGLTGDRGYGPECRDRNRDVANFTATHPMQANANRLATVGAEIATVAAEVSDSQAGFEQNRDTLIAQRVTEAREHQGAIGLLERMNALHALASTSLALFLGTWAVRLFFVLADCLPVVVKFSGGSSEYDKIFRAQSAGSVERHTMDLAMLGDEAETHRRKHKADLDLELQEHRADASLRRGNAVRRVSSQLLHPPSVPRS